MTRQRLTRNEAIDLLIEAKVVAPENRSMVLGTIRRPQSADNGE